MLAATENKPTLAYPYYIYPLRVAKQIATMFFSVNDVVFRNGLSLEVSLAGTDLAGFVLNPERRRLPRPFRLFTYFTVSDAARLVGWSRMAHEGQRFELTEITFPPFGYVMTSGTGPPHPNMVEISAFADRRDDEFEMLHMALPVLETTSPFPGDYRPRAEVVAAREEVQEVRGSEGEPTSLRVVRVRAE